MTNARDIAERVLERVDDDRAYAAAALDAELDRAPALDPRERALATELSYGVLRTRAALTRRLEALAKNGLPDPFVARTLSIAAYQILALERVPVHAAVNEAVRRVVKRRGRAAGGFANAILRRLSQHPQKLSLSALVRESAPAWLLERLEMAVGVEEALGLFGVGVPLGENWARLIDGRKPPVWAENAPVGRASPRARRLPSGDPERLEGYREGAFVTQEQGAQVVGLALGARPGERVLDACAGRGQKASLLSEMVGSGGSVWAADLFPAKLEALRREHERLALPEPRTTIVDWRAGGDALPSDFDRVLVDAPCTGTGTLRRRPEIIGRLTPGDPERLAELSLAILRAAASHARPGGRVVFAVCSVLGDEAEKVVERALDLLEPAPFDAPELASLLPSDRSSFRLLPLVHGTDGYFLASFARRSRV